MLIYLFTNVSHLRVVVIIIKTLKAFKTLIEKTWSIIFKIKLVLDRDKFPMFMGYREYFCNNYYANIESI